MVLIICWAGDPRTLYSTTVPIASSASMHSFSEVTNERNHSVKNTDKGKQQPSFWKIHDCWCFATIIRRRVQYLETSTLGFGNGLISLAAVPNRPTSTCEFDNSGVQGRQRVCSRLAKNAALWRSQQESVCAAAAAARRLQIKRLRWLEDAVGMDHRCGAASHLWYWKAVRSILGSSCSSSSIGWCWWWGFATTAAAPGLPMEATNASSESQWLWGMCVMGVCVSSLGLSLLAQNFDNCAPQSICKLFLYLFFLQRCCCGDFSSVKISLVISYMCLPLYLSYLQPVVEISLW